MKLGETAGTPLDRVLSFVMLAIPCTLGVAAVVLRAPILLVPFVAWLTIASQLPHEGGFAARLVPLSAVQLRRLLLAVLLVLAIGVVGLVVISAVLTAATIENGWLIGAALVGSVAAATWALGTVPRIRDAVGSPLVPWPLTAAIVTIAAMLAIADRIVLFQYTLFLGVLVGVAAVLTAALVRAARRLRRAAPSIDLEVPLISLLLAAVLVSFVATLELSALGSYDLVQLADRSRRHDLVPSRRARVNSFGFRGPERPLAKAPGVLRVAILGDSLSYGWFITEEQTFARRLERDLAGALPGHAIEVLNGGVPAYSLWMMREQFTIQIEAHRPDVVVLVDGGNTESDPAGGYERELRATLDVLQSSGVRIVLCGYPFGSEQASARWQTEVKSRIAAERGLTFVDLARARDFLGEDFFQPDGHHPTVAGHAAIAAVLGPVLREVLQPVAAPSAIQSL